MWDGSGEQKGEKIKMEEYLDIRDWDGNLTGQKKERTLVHQDGDIHGTSHIWIIRKSRENKHSADVLLQKRSRNKDTFPGCYDISSAGHILSGEDFLDTALRELWEELGIKARPEELHFLFLHRQEVDMNAYGKPYYDREISAVYAYVRDISLEELHLQKEEVDFVCWMDFEEYQRHLNEKDPQFCIHLDEYRKVCEYIRQTILKEISPTWNEDCLAELDEWIESQGIYIRQ